MRLTTLLRILALAVVFTGAAAGADARMRLEPAFADRPATGPSAARGAIVWSHGRSLHIEDSEAPTPSWLVPVQEAGWDVYRFNRLSKADSLPGSSQVLAGWVEELRRRGYRSVALAGQSFGAFLSLLAASSAEGVDAVVATAPAAFGSFSNSYATWRLNATRLYATLETVKTPRVMMFFFHGDEFDPGGRAEKVSDILGRRGLDHVVVDQPADLPGHGAANTGLFVRRFGACIVAFIDPARAVPAEDCEEPWGRRPSPLMATVRDGTAGGAAQPSTPFGGRWYGFYLNGREVLLSIDSVRDGKVRATYALGPGVVPGQVAEKVTRQGRVVGSEIVFEEPGFNRLRYALRPDGKLAGTWSAHDGSAQLDILLHRVDW